MPVAKKCVHCNPATYYESIAEYNNHLKVAHQAESEYIGDAYKCDECGAGYFDTCAALESHKRTHP